MCLAIVVIEVYRLVLISTKPPYKGTYERTQTWTNGIVTPQMGPTTVRYTICHIKPYKSETYVDYVNM